MDNETTILVVGAVVAYLLMKRSAAGGGLFYSSGSGLFGSRTTVQTPYGSYATGPYGTQVSIPSGAISALETLFGGASGRGSGTGVLATPQPAPNTDPQGTMFDNLPIADPSAGPGLLPIDYNTAPTDPTLDPSGGSDPYSVLAYDPSAGGDVVGALATG